MSKTWFQICDGNAKQLTPVINKACECFGLEINGLRDATDGETCDNVTRTWSVVEALCTYETACALSDAVQFARELQQLWK